MTLRLAIDTTGKGGAVVLARGAEVIGESIHDEARGYAEHLFDLLDEALAEGDVARGEVEEIAVVSGPGSFTGLRIGVMTAKTLAHAMEIPLIAAPTLGLIAAAADGSGVSLAPAGGDHVWLLRFADPAVVDADVPVERIALDVALRSGGPFLVADAGLFDRIEGHAAVRRVPALARSLIAAVHAKHPTVRTVDPLAFVPEYVTPSQAERVHGVDLRDRVAKPIRPRGWD